MSAIASKIRIVNHDDFPNYDSNAPFTEIDPIDFIVDTHTPYAESEFLVDEAKSWLDIVQKYNYQVLSRSSDFSSKYDFSEVLYPAENIIKLFVSIDINKLDMFSVYQLKSIINNSKKVLELFGFILKYDPNNPIQSSRDSLISEFHTMENNVIDNMSLIVGYSNAFKSNEKDIELKISKILDKYEEERQKDIIDLANRKNETSEILSQLKEASALKGIGLESDNFSEISKSYDKDAEKWFNRSKIMGIFTLFVAILSSLSYKIPCIAPETNIESAQLISGKFIILGILSYGLIVCIRNYNAQIHNAVVNRHRQNSLQTYRAFVDAASSNVARDIVLTHAAAAVFLPQDTGYVRNQDSSGARSIIEMIPKSLVGDTKPG